MEAVGTRTVHLIHATLLTRLQVEQPEVGFGMPNGEIAPVGNGVHKIASVGRRPRPGDGRLVGRVDECVDIAGEAPCALVKSYAAENVLFFVVVNGIELAAGSNKVKPLAVGREGRTGLCPIATHGECVANDAMLLYIVDEDIALGVVDLDALWGIRQMEHLRGFVGRESTIATTRVPAGIDKRAWCRR